MMNAARMGLEEDITTDLTVLQSHLDGMIDRLQHNSLTLKRFQSFEMRLLSLSSLAELVDFILTQTQAYFDLDAISLCLYDGKNEISDCLANEGYDYRNKESLFLIRDEKFLNSAYALSNRPYLGYHPQDCSEYFPNHSKPASVVIAPLNRRGKYLGSLNLGSYQANRFIDTMATDFVEHIASVVGICLENSLNFETMRRTSLLDTLTGVNNRRFLEQRIEEELDACQRSRQPLSCLFLDIDFFKLINDGHGHQAGDFVLAQVAGAIKKQLRNNDVLSRYGGEEFVALLIHSDEKMAREIAERIRINIEALRLEYNRQAIPVTLSIGAATYQPVLGVQESGAQIAGRLIQAADAGLYAAKRQGRNRVESVGSDHVMAS